MTANNHLFKRENFYSILFLFAGACILISPAFYNGYPLVISDTGTYIASGFELKVPPDRPIFYGLFLRITSSKISLWGTIFFQALIVSYVLQKFILLFTKLKNVNRTSFGLIILLVLTTPSGWFCSELIPDIFTPIACLSLTILILSKEKSLLNKISIWFIFFYSVLVHYSHLMIFLSVSLLILIISIFQKKILKRSIIIFATAILAWLTVPTVNFFIDGNFKVSKGGDIFLMGKLAEYGILQNFLTDNCKRSNFQLCNFRENIPTDFNEFLWSGNSPLYKIGGWSENNNEYKTIIRNCFTNDKYLKIYLRESFHATYHQLKRFNLYYPECPNDNPASWEIEKNFPNELSAYRSSKQSKGKLREDFFKTFNPFQKIFIGLSTLLILIVFFLIKRDQKYMVSIVAMSIIINSFVCTFFSCVTDRLNGRIIWLIPYILFLGILIILPSLHKSSSLS